MSTDNWTILDSKPDVQMWHESNEPDHCPAIHPDAQAWEPADRTGVTETHCWRPPHDAGPHYFVNPPRCKECGAIDLHSDDCSAPEAGRDSWVEWTTQTAGNGDQQ